MLRDTGKLLQGQGIRLVFANLTAQVRGQFDRYGLTEILGEQAIDGSIHAVVAAYEPKPAGPEATTSAATDGAA